MRSTNQFTIYSLNDVVSGTTAPTNPYKGQLWVNTAYSPPRTYTYNGTGWVETNGIGTIRSNVTTLQTRASNLETKVTGLTSTVSTLTTQVDENGETLATLSSDISTLQQTATELSAEVTGKVNETHGTSTSSFGWSLKSTGFYVYSNARTVMQITSSGLSVVGAIDATSGSIGNLTIDGNLYFGEAHEYYISPNEDDEDYYINLPGFRVDDESGAVFSGKLSAPSGTIGGFTIGTTNIHTESKTSYGSSTTGVYVGTDGIGLGTGAFYVTSGGYLYAKSGSVGGFTLSTTGIYKTKTSYNSTTEGVYLGTTGIGLGAGTFYVTSAGHLYATDAEIAGSITANAGSVENLTVKGFLYFGGNTSYYLNANYDDTSYYINLPGFRVDDASGAVFSGKLSAPSGSIGGFTISSSAIYKTKTSYNSSTSGVYIGTNGIGLGAGTFYVTSAGALTASNVNITGGSIKLGLSTSNMYTQVDSSGIRCGGFDWASFRLEFGSLTLAANQWGDSSKINRIRLGWFGGADTGISQFGMCGELADEDYYISATDTQTYLNGVGMYLRARYGVTCKGHFWGTWTTSSSISVSSDARVKNSIEALPECYSKVFDGLCPVRFKYNDGKSGRYHVGFVAQQVKDSMDAAGVDGMEFAGLCIAQTDDSLGEEWSLRYEEFIAINTLEIQKLKKRVAELENLLKTEENANETLRNPGSETSPGESA